MPTSPGSVIRPESLTLAVYAPFGTDNVLATYPGGASQNIAEHPLLKNLISAYTQRWLLVLGLVYIVTIVGAPDGLWNLAPRPQDS